MCWQVQVFRVVGEGVVVVRSCCYLRLWRGSTCLRKCYACTRTQLIKSAGS